ncbi:MAG: TPM domain-containing protein [archaeon]
MKSSVALFFLCIIFLTAATPEAKYFLNDYTGAVNSEDATQIESILKEIYDSGTAEYAIVIVDSLNGSDIEGYSYKLAEGNLGDASKNNGLLLLVALQDRQYRFEVGRGIEDVLPDIIMARIGRKYIEPNFKAGDYGIGIIEASTAVRDILANNTESRYYEDPRPDGLATGITIFIILVIIAILIIVAASKGKTPKRLRKNEDYFTAAWLISQMMKGGKGGSGGGFGGGGFGGFGGGSFGGGGAGGRW